jgi:hypothetical protein
MRAGRAKPPRRALTERVARSPKRFAPVEDPVFGGRMYLSLDPRREPWI